MLKLGLGPEDRASTQKNRWGIEAPDLQSQQLCIERGSTLVGSQTSRSPPYWLLEINPVDKAVIGLGANGFSKHVFG